MAKQELQIDEEVLKQCIAEVAHEIQELSKSMAKTSVDPAEHSEGSDEPTAASEDAAPHADAPEAAPAADDAPVEMAPEHPADDFAGEASSPGELQVEGESEASLEEQCEALSDDELKEVYMAVKTALMARMSADAETAPEMPEAPEAPMAEGMSKSEGVSMKKAEHADASHMAHQASFKAHSTHSPQDHLDAAAEHAGAAEAHRQAAEANPHAAEHHQNMVKLHTSLKNHHSSMAPRKSKMTKDEETAEAKKEDSKEDKKEDSKEMSKHAAELADLRKKVQEQDLLIKKFASAIKPMRKSVESIDEVKIEDVKLVKNLTKAEINSKLNEKIKSGLAKSDQKLIVAYSYGKVGLDAIKHLLS